MRMTRLAGLSAGLLVVAAGIGCGDPCGDPEDRVVPASELPCSMVDADGVWQSHPLPPITEEQCYWLEFRGCSRYEIAHPLSTAPSFVVGYISFDPDGSYATLGSGDSFVIEDVNDATVTIRNTQNQRFFLRLLLQ